MKIILKIRFCFLLLLILKLSISCKQSSSSKTSLPGSTNTIIKTSDQLDTSFVVKDSNQYSHRFLEKLKTSGYAIKYQFIDSMLIMNTADTVFFPTYLPINEKIEFTGKINNRSISLFARRKNYTTIDFELMIINSGKLPDKQTGEADIGTLFFLGAESDEDDKTGLAYFATEYSKIDSTCELSIRIGDDNDQSKAKLKRKCSDREKDIDLDNCPTLRKIN